MLIRIANKIRITNPPPLLKEVLINQLRVPNPKHLDAIRMGYRAYGIPQYLFNFELLPDGSIDVPRGLRQTLLAWIVKREYNIPEHVEIVDDRTLIEHQLIDCSNIKLREYQSKALTDLLKGGPEGLLVSKAGSGKTVMGLSLLALFGQKMLWITHTTPLANQVIERLREFMPELTEDDIGQIGGGKWKIGNKFTVAMVQTLVRKPAEAWAISNEFGIIVVDECHHVPATTFIQVISTFNPFYLYGLTATPTRKDGLSNLMIQTMGQVTASVSAADINKAGGVVNAKVKRRDIRYKDDNALSDDDPYQVLIKKLYENPARNGIIVNDVLNELRQDNFCIVLTERKKHAEILYEMLKRWHKKVGIATGNNTPKQNAETLAQLTNGEIDCLVATSHLLGEGFDEAKINRAFLGLPIRNEVRIEQIVGRIQRPSAATGKFDSIIYDYVDPHSLFVHQFTNRGDKGCRTNVYNRLDCKISTK